ncbi:hypothetical protein FA95DRAFT_1684025 [Auriscalpium vulgare]|uniref:Uncharacterized protein n=1 Tax=Auriscalpium vulgare TaxID=40419 RepID=A0ACB8R7G4_9AGAM|nr:hypothetical protein FA95DRAFT_1684025 [Auriscalpium vulgare]
MADTSLSPPPSSDSAEEGAKVATSAANAVSGQIEDSFPLVQKFPFEVLYNIFLYAQLEPVAFWSWYIVTHVCRQWRMAALAYEELWCTIDVSWPIALIQTAAQRAGSAVRREVYTSNFIELDDARVFEINSALVSARSLDLRVVQEVPVNVGSDPNLLEFITLGSNLEEVTLIRNGEGTQYLNNMTINAPKLKKLVLGRYWFPNWPQSFLKLRSLSVQNSSVPLTGMLEDFIEALSIMADVLEELVLLDIPHGPNPFSTDALPPNKLTYLRLEGGANLSAKVLSWISPNPDNVFIDLDIKNIDIRGVNELFHAIGRSFALSTIPSFRIESQQTHFKSTRETRMNLDLIWKPEATLKFILTLWTCDQDAFVQAVRKVYSSEVLPSTVNELDVISHPPEFRDGSDSSILGGGSTSSGDSNEDKEITADHKAVIGGMQDWIKEGKRISSNRVGTLRIPSFWASDAGATVSDPDMTDWIKLRFGPRTDPQMKRNSRS